MIPAATAFHPGPAAPRRPRFRGRTLLAAALAVSLAVHLALTALPGLSPDAADEAPLAVTLTELPPPPAPQPAVAPAPPPKAAAKPKAARRPQPPSATPAIALPGPEPLPEVGPPAPDAGSPAVAAANPEPPRLVEEVSPPAGDAAPPPRTLPPRIDLAYKVFLGRQGFEIGDATYRFEHRENRYRITTLGQARGLAALVLRGQGRVESRGLITPAGLQPLEFSAGLDRRAREVARFDWESGVVTLRDDKPAAIETPTFDPLSLMWQYYFTPPDADRVVVHVATTRRIARYTLQREGADTIQWNGRALKTERWARRSDDGKTEATAWLAPALRYIPVKMRVVNTDRGTLEVMLDAIRVDETGETVGRDDIALQPSPVSPGPAPGAAAAPDAMQWRPGAAFPTMTP